MKQTAVLLSIIIVLFAITGCSSGGGNKEAVTAAINATQTWLKIVDGGDYGKSWDEGSGYFKSVMSRDKWGLVIKANREPLGGVQTREVRGKQYLTSLDGLGDGQYVAIEFSTDFDNKKAATEAITTMLDKDGKWRTAIYVIK